MLSYEENKKKAIKLHGPLCHASKEQLVKLLKDSGCDDKEFLKIVVDCCDNCQCCSKFRKSFKKKTSSSGSCARWIQQVCWYGPNRGRKMEGVDTSLD